MCFSATASFTAGTLLLALGAVALRAARRPAEKPYAAIPLLFGAQQITEGLVWLALAGTLPGMTVAATQVYSFFSHVLWPVYIPVAAWLLETDPRRRRLMFAVMVAGLAVGGYLLYALVDQPITAHVVGGHIDYHSPHFYIALSLTLYLTATTASLLLSTHAPVRWFGALALASSAAAYAFYARWFISVWCFFAALLSVVVLLHLIARRPNPFQRMSS